MIQKRTTTLRLGPAALFEMVMQRRHLQDAPALAVLLLRVLEVSTCRHHRDLLRPTKMPPMIASTISCRTITAMVPKRAAEGERADVHP